MKRAALTRGASKERTERRKVGKFLNTETAVNQRDSRAKRTSISIPKNPPGDLHESWSMLFRSAEERPPRSKGLTESPRNPELVAAWKQLRKWRSRWR